MPDDKDKKPKKLSKSEKPTTTLEQALAGGMPSILDYLAPTQLAITPNWIEMGSSDDQTADKAGKPGMYIKTLFIYTYPRYLQTNWLSPIINYDITMDVSMFIYPLKSKNVMSGLSRKSTQLQSTMTIEQEKGLIRDPELETAITDIEALRDVIQRGEVRLFQAGLYFTIYAKTKQELETITEQLDSTLGGMLTYVKPALLQMEPGFNSTLPLFEDELSVLRNLDTGSLSTTFPFVSVELTSNKGILYGINRHNNSLIIFDRFDLENANSVVFAKAGAGKSYAIKLEILRSLMFGTDILVIDPENEYKTLCEAIGGTYINISLNSPTRINPFDLPAAGPDETGENILRNAVINLHGLISLMVGGLTPEESSLLEQALYQTYSLKDITADPASHRNTVPLMSDLEQILQNMQGSASLALRLQRFTRGTFAGLFNQPTNISLQDRFVTFSIRDLEEQLRPIAMFMCLNFIWAQVRRELRPRILVIDEAWWMMQYEDSARFLMGLAKRARKYYLGVTVISQDVEDFLASRYGRAVINNSSMQLLLKQSPAAIDQIAEVFHLTEGEKYLLLESEVGEGLFFAGLKHVAIKVIASYTEDQIITTDPRQLMALRTELEAAPKTAPLVAPTPYEQALVEGKPVPVPEKDQTREIWERRKQEAATSDKRLGTGDTRQAQINNKQQTQTQPQQPTQPEVANIPAPEPQASANGRWASGVGPLQMPPVPSKPEEPSSPQLASSTPEKPPTPATPQEQKLQSQPETNPPDAKATGAIEIDEKMTEKEKEPPAPPATNVQPTQNPYSLAEKREAMPAPSESEEKPKIKFFYKTPPGASDEQQATSNKETTAQPSAEAEDFWGEKKNGTLE